MFGKAIKKTIVIEGMHCSHCSGRVKEALEAVEGVKAAKVSHESGKAEVKLSHEVPDDTLMQAVNAQGFDAVRVER